MPACARLVPQGVGAEPAVRRLQCGVAGQQAESFAQQRPVVAWEVRVAGKQEAHGTRTVEIRGSASPALGRVHGEGEAEFIVVRPANAKVEQPHCIRAEARCPEVVRQQRPARRPRVGRHAHHGARAFATTACGAAGEGREHVTVSHHDWLEARTLEVGDQRIEVSAGIHAGRRVPDIDDSGAGGIGRVARLAPSPKRRSA
jgi:hypothetical protein